MIEFIADVAVKSITTIFRLVIILVPVMIILEYAKYFHVLEKLTLYFGWLPRSLGMSAKAVFPLIVGLFVGVTYGAAVIIDYSRQGSISKRDLMLCGVFLAINHSIIEDHLLFASLGANLYLLLPARFLLAFLITKILSSYFYTKSEEMALERGRV